MFSILAEIMQLDFIHFQTMKIGRTFLVTLRSGVINTLDERILQSKLSRFAVRAFENGRSNENEHLVISGCRKSSDACWVLVRSKHITECNW